MGIKKSHPERNQDDDTLISYTRHAQRIQMDSVVPFLIGRCVDLIEEFVLNYLRHQAVNCLYGCLAAATHRQKTWISLMTPTGQTQYPEIEVDLEVLEASTASMFLMHKLRLLFAWFGLNHKHVSFHYI